jgi:tight adherence protein B
MALVAGGCAVAGAWELLAELDGRAPVRALGRLLAPLRAGREPAPAERRRLVLVGAGTLLAAGWLVGGAAGGLVAAAAGPWLVARLLRLRARRRRTALVAAAPAVARAMGDALAGGHAIRGALLAAVAAVPGPAGAELRRATAGLAVGEPTDAVLDAVRRRAAAPAWETLTAAVLLQRDAGGDLAGLLRDLAARLEQARRDEADARSATAQARFTAWLVAALPLGAAALAELGSPGYLASLAATPVSAVLVAASAALQLLAVLAIRGIARVGEGT